MGNPDEFGFEEDDGDGADEFGFAEDIISAPRRGGEEDSPVGKPLRSLEDKQGDVMPMLSERTRAVELEPFDVRPEAPPRARDAVDIPQPLRDGFNATLQGLDRVFGMSNRAQYFARQQGRDPSAIRPVEAPDSYSPGAIAVGGAQALTLGHADELGGAAASLVRGTPYRQEQEAAEARDARIQQEAPGSYAVGTAAGTAPWMLLPGVGEWAGEQAAARGAGGFAQGAARVAGTAAEGAAFGGAAAEGASTADAGSEQWRSDVGAGLASGAVMSGGAQALAEVPGAVRGAAQRLNVPGLQEMADRLRVRAAGGRTADIQRLGQRPGGVSGFADSLRDAGLTGARSTTAEIGERAATVREQAGTRIGEILSEASSSAAPSSGYRSPPPLHNEVDRLVARIQSEVVAPLERNPLPEARTAARNMSQFLDAVQADRSPLTPARIHNIQRTLDSGINWRAQTVQEASVAGARREARGVVRSELDRSLEAAGERIGNPELLDEYSRHRRAYGAANEVSDWTERESAREASNRLISPTDYITTLGSGVAAAADGDFSAKDAAYVAGGLALNRFVRRREHSLAATGLEALSRALSRPQTARSAVIPPALRSTLANALRRGSAVYAATVLSKLLEGTPEEQQAIRAAMQGTEPEPAEEIAP